VESVAPVSVPADGVAEPEAAPAVDAEPGSNGPVDIEEPATDATKQGHAVHIISVRKYHDAQRHAD